VEPDSSLMPTSFLALATDFSQRDAKGNATGAKGRGGTTEGSEVPTGVGKGFGRLVEGTAPCRRPPPLFASSQSLVRKQERDPGSFYLTLFRLAQRPQRSQRLLSG